MTDLLFGVRRRFPVAFSVLFTSSVEFQQAFALIHFRLSQIKVDFWAKIFLLGNAKFTKLSLPLVTIES